MLYYKLGGTDVHVVVCLSSIYLSILLIQTHGAGRAVGFHLGAFFIYLFFKGKKKGEKKF